MFSKSFRKPFFHAHTPFISTVKDPELFREKLWMDEHEIEQRNQIDAKLVGFARDLEIITDLKGSFVRVEYSQSEPQSLVLTTNYRYVLLAEQIVQFYERTEILTDLFMDLHTRLCVGYSPTLLDKLITRTYAALTIAPNEDNLDGTVDHDLYPQFWVYPYFKQRMHELLAVGIPHK